MEFEVTEQEAYDLVFRLYDLRDDKQDFVINNE